MRTLLRPLAWLLRRISRPITDRFDAHLMRVIDRALHEQQDRSVTSLRHLSVFRDELIHHIGTLGARLDNVQHAEHFETQLIVDGVVRELIRLQHQVAVLAEFVEAAAEERAPQEASQHAPLVIGPREAQVA